MPSDGPLTTPHHAKPHLQALHHEKQAFFAGGCGMRMVYGDEMGSLDVVILSAQALEPDPRFHSY